MNELSYRLLLFCFNSPSPSTRMHGPPHTTRSSSPLSTINLLTASSAAPGCIQAAFMSSLLNSSNNPRVTYGTFCFERAYPNKSENFKSPTFGGVMMLTDVVFGDGRSASEGRVVMPCSSFSFCMCVVHGAWCKQGARDRHRRH